jgi:probable phosphoglycerate mutase
MYILLAFFSFLLFQDAFGENAHVSRAADIFLTTLQVILDDVQGLEMSDTKTQRIYIVRHGESELNKSAVQGVEMTLGKSLHVRLTHRGEHQATELAKKLSKKIHSDEKFLIVSSTAQRTQKTAQLLFETLRTSHLEAELGESYEGLCELGMGDWEGKPKDQAYEEALDQWNQLSQAKKFTTHKVEGGESFKEVAQRALKELGKISNQYRGQTIFVVSHFHTMNAIALELSGKAQLLSEDQSLDLPFLIFKNCDLLELEFSQEDEIEQATVKMHLHNF